MSSHQNPDFEINKRGFTVYVKNNDIEYAIKQLKKLLMNEGMHKDMKKKEFYEKPSQKRRREKAEARRRLLKKKKEMNI